VSRLTHSLYEDLKILKQTLDNRPYTLSTSFGEARVLKGRRNAVPCVPLKEGNPTICHIHRNMRGINGEHKAVNWYL